MITKETSRLSAPGYALRSNAAKKTRKTGEESTLKNTVSCVDNPGHYIPSLDDAALAAAYNTRWTSARNNGLPVGVWTTLRYNFSLSD